MFHGKTLKNSWFPADFPLNNPNDQFIKNEGGGESWCQSSHLPEVEGISTGDAQSL